MKPHESLPAFHRTYLTNQPEGALSPGDDGTGQIYVYNSALTGPQLLPYQQRDFYKISLLTGGTSWLHYATRSLAITQPALVFVNPLVPYAWEKETGPNTGIYCSFTEAFWQGNRIGLPPLAESPLFRPSGQPVFLLSEAQVPFLTQLFQQLLAEVATDYAHKHDVLRNYVQLIIHEALKMQPALSYVVPRNAASRIAGMFAELLERQFSLASPDRPVRLRTPLSYASALAVHVNHLNRAVRTVTGKTTSALLAERLVREATALLRHSHWSVAEIADSLGFTYPNYFNTFFKKHTGHTPLQVRHTGSEMV